LFLPEDISSETESQAFASHAIARATAEGEAVVDGVNSNGRDPALVTAVVFYLLARGLRVGFLMCVSY
jgi:hypothetical protein